MYSRITEKSPYVREREMYELYLDGLTKQERFDELNDYEHGYDCTTRAIKKQPIVVEYMQEDPYGYFEEYVRDTIYDSFLDDGEAIEDFDIDSIWANELIEDYLKEAEIEQWEEIY